MACGSVVCVPDSYHPLPHTHFSPEDRNKTLQQRGASLRAGWDGGGLNSHR